MTKDEALKLALEALETAEIDGNCEYGATEIIRKALTQPEQEPVVWLKRDGGVADWGSVECGDTPLYNTPPQRKESK